MEAKTAGLDLDPATLPPPPASTPVPTLHKSLMGPGGCSSPGRGGSRRRNGRDGARSWAGTSPGPSPADPKPASNGASGLGPAVLSASLFALYNFAAAILCRPLLGQRCPLWADLGFDPWFLAASFALGLACARLALATRSIRPGALLHWTILLGWVVLFGGPG